MAYNVCNVFNFTLKPCLDGRKGKTMEPIKKLETTEKKLQKEGYHQFGWGNMGTLYRKGKETALVRLNGEVWEVRL